MTNYMIDTLLDEARKLATSWQVDADHRREISHDDPIADTLVYCASDLLAHLQDMDDGTLYLTVEDWSDQYGAKRGKHPPTPRTVRGWIRDGKLKAMGLKGNERVHRDAQPKKAK